MKKEYKNQPKFIVSKFTSSYPVKFSDSLPTIVEQSGKVIKIKKDERLRKESI